MYLGIDVSKAKIDCCLMTDERYLHRVVKNNPDGFKKLSEWIAKYTNEPLHVCLEATGIYGEAAAEYLHDAGYKVSIANPLSIKRFAQMELNAVKTDRQDAKTIARYCAIHKPPEHRFATPSERTLKALTRQIDYLTEMATAQKNRLSVAHPSTQGYIAEMLTVIEQQIDEVRQAVATHIKADEALKEQADHLKQIRGIGEKTVPHLISLFADKQFENAKKVVSYLGLNPIIKQSGQKKSRTVAISKQGDKHIRTALYMPAVVCFRLPEYRPFVQRLLAVGKAKKQIIVALMRKLAEKCYRTIQAMKPVNLQRELENCQGEAL